MTLLVDDQLLSAHLRSRWTPPGEAPMYTTGCWYVRLCTAVALARGGSLSGPFAMLPPGQRDAAVRAVLSLPDAIGLVSLRDLAPLMGELAARHGRLNLLSREALASAILLRARILMAEGNQNQALTDALVAEGGEAEVVSLR